jgi:hypothetical protein
LLKLDPRLFICAMAVACTSSRADGNGVHVVLPQSPDAQAGAVLFSGACDASAAVALSESSFVVADDEDNVLRVYDADKGGAPTSKLDVSSFVGVAVDGKKRSKKRAPEMDLEAATRIGDRAYFVSSHARSSSGKLKSERLRFFATSAAEDGRLSPIGRPYDDLLDDLLDDPRFETYGLRAAARLPPKARGGLNLEGMTARVPGGVWLGFRNPIPEGRALLVPLLNPEGLIAGESARFGEPITLDLGGLGVRGLSFWRGRYLIAAGPSDGGAASKLLTWDGHRSVAVVASHELTNYNPEAFFTPETRDRILLLSDEGTRLIGSVECKRLEDPSRKYFRGLWLTLPSSGTG